MGLGGENLVAVLLDEPEADGTVGYVENYPGQHEVEKNEPPSKPKRRIVSERLWKEDPIFARKVEEVERLHLAKELIVNYAGAAAQFPRAQGYSLDWFANAAKDMRNSDLSAWEVGYWPPREWDFAYWAALEVVDAHFAEIEALARALAKRRRLTGSEMLEIVARAPKYRNPHRQRWFWADDQAPEQALAERLVAWRDRPLEEPIALREAAMTEGES